MTKLYKVLIVVGAFFIFGKKPVVETHPAYARMTEAATDLETALARRPWPEAVQSKRARIVFEFAGEESSFYTNPPGFNDNGAACGVMQLHNPQLDLPAATCEAVRKDRVLGFEAGIARIQRLEKECGSIAEALSAYAWRGECTHGIILDIVKRRCRKAGLSETCE